MKNSIALRLAIAARISVSLKADMVALNLNLPRFEAILAFTLPRLQADT
jgi:hypothetical protein